MKKLNNDQIRFIETYLENSDVFYADIRMEMTDHVASAIEKEMNDRKSDDFYEIFKFYMIKNKANLLESNQKFLRNVDKSIIHRLFKNLIKPWSILIFLVIGFISFQAFAIIGQKRLLNYSNWFPILSLVPFVILYFGTLKSFKISRFSGIERLAFAYMVFFQVVNLFQILFRNHIETNSEGHFLIAIGIAFMFTMAILLFKLTYTIIRDYQKQYKLI